MKSILKISREFHRCLSKLDEIPNINNGGCGISVLAMYRWLERKDYLQGDEKFVFLYRWNDEFYRNNNLALNKTHGFQFCSCAHVLFYFNGFYYDSNGKQNDYIESRWYRMYHTVTYEQLIEAINNRETWNNDFKRKNYVPLIESKLNISLSDIDKTDVKQKEDSVFIKYFGNIVNNSLPFR